MTRSTLVARPMPDLICQIGGTVVASALLLTSLALLPALGRREHTLSIALGYPRFSGPPLALEDLPNRTDLIIAADGRVTYHGQAIDAATLETLLVHIGREEDQPDVCVTPAPGTPYRQVIHVLSAAQRLGVIRLGLRSTAPKKVVIPRAGQDAILLDSLCSGDAPPWHMRREYLKL